MNVDPKQEMALARTETDEELAMLRDLLVVDEETCELATEAIRELKARYEAFEAKRTAVTKPINESLREVNGWFKPVTEKLQAGIAMCKSKIAEYQTKQVEANRAAMLAACAAPTPEVAAKALAVVAVPHQPSGVSVRESWDFEITEPARVPREFLMVDVDKLKAFARASTDEPVVSGVRFFIKKTVAVRAK